MKHLTKEQINSLVLNPADADGEWMNHIHECEACRFEYEADLAIHQSLSNLSHHQPSIRFAKNIIESLEKGKKVILANKLWTRITIGSIFFAFAQAWMMLMYLIVQINDEFAPDLDGYWASNTLGWGSTLAGTMLSLWGFYLFDKWLMRKKTYLKSI